MKHKRDSVAGAFAALCVGIARLTFGLCVWAVVMIGTAAQSVLLAMLSGIRGAAIRSRAALDDRAAKIYEPPALPADEWDEGEDDEDEPDPWDEIEDEEPQEDDEDGPWETWADEDEEAAFSAYLHGRTFAKARADEERRLWHLFRRLNRIEELNRTDADTWARCQKSKTYRGLLFDIQETEELIAKLDAYIDLRGVE